MLVTEVLSDLGYTAIQAPKRRGGSEDAPFRQIDLLVSVVGLPGGMNGAERRMRGERAAARLKLPRRQRPPGARHASSDQAIFAMAPAGRIQDVIAET